MKMEKLLVDRVGLVPVKRRRPRAEPWGTPEEGVLSWMQLADPETRDLNQLRVCPRVQISM